ncbi:hypothetical protein QUB77_17685 [Microcoleus sp. AT9b-C3]
MITPVAGVSVAWLRHRLSIERLINAINSIAQHFVFSPVPPPEYKIVAICGVRSNSVFSLKISEQNSNL